MPSLTWPQKAFNEPEPVSLLPEADIYPGGVDFLHARPENRLLLGDNLSIMASLLPEYEGRIDLIYVDPPFFTNRKFLARVGRGEDSRKPAEWDLAEGYRDSWSNLDTYLDFLYPRLVMMHRLLSPKGMLYLHLDWHADAYARLLLDEIFGADHFLNEIVWIYHGPSPIRSAFNRKHDVILSYTKSKDYTFNADAVREPYNPSTVKTFGASPKAGFGKVPDLERGKVPEDWWYFPVVARLHNERTGYPTQKPEALLERIILASSNPGDLVADFFSGSGTTPLVAARHGRRFLASDITWRAIHTTRSRLTALPSDPFAFDRTQSMSWQIENVDASLFGVELSDGKVRLGKFEDIDYWEIDPAWNGETFRSALQAGRPVRSGEIKRVLELPFKRENQPVCIRLVTIQGEQFQIILN